MWQQSGVGSLAKGLWYVEGVGKVEEVEEFEVCGGNLVYCVGGGES